MPSDGNLTVSHSSSVGSPLRNVEEKVLENDTIKMLNYLIVVLRVDHPRVSSLLQISSNIYSTLFGKLFQAKPLDLIANPQSLEDEAHNAQCVIDTLSFDILGISLSHVTGEDLVARRFLPIYHLLEIFKHYAKMSLDEQMVDRPLTSTSVTVPLLSSSDTATSSASHQENFCMLCEYSKAKGQLNINKVGSNIVEKGLAGPSRASDVLEPHNQGSLDEETTTSSAISSSSVTISLETTSQKQDDSSFSLNQIETDLPKRETHKRKRLNSGQSFNELLTRRLAKNLQQMTSTPQKKFKATAEEMPQLRSHSSLDHLYKSVFRSPVNKAMPTPVSKTSVLLPRYLRKNRISRKSSASKTIPQETPVKSHRRTSENEGILREIHCNIPGIQPTSETLKRLANVHQQQVKYLSNQINQQRRRITEPQKLYQENVQRQLKLSEIERRNQEDELRLAERRNERSVALRTRGALRDKNIQKAKVQRYFDQYYVQHKRKLGLKKAKEELLLEDLYKHRLAIQKKKVQALTKELRTQEHEKAEVQRNRIASMNNFYEDQLQMLKESGKEKKVHKEMQIKAQSQVLEQTRQAILKQIESETKVIQENLECRDDFHFQEGDAQKLKEYWNKKL